MDQNSSGTTPPEQATQTPQPNQVKPTITEALGKHPKVAIAQAPGDVSKKILLLGAFFGILLVAVFLFLLTNRPSTEQDPLAPTPTPSPIDPTPTPTPTPAPRAQRYVAFIKNDPHSNVYVVESSGETTTKITNNSDDRTVYSLINWQAYDTMVYAKCGVSGGGCQIIKRSITSGEETVVIESRQFPAGTIIRALQYDNKGDTLGVYYEAPDGRAFATLFEDDRQISLKEFPVKNPREAEFADEISVTFSPDDAHVIIVTTVHSPNTDPKFPTLYVFNTDTGASLFGLGSNSLLAHAPHWTSNQTFLFSQDDQILEKNIRTQGEIIVLPTDTRNLEVSELYDGKYSTNNTLTFWTTLEDGRTSIGISTGSPLPNWLVLKTNNFYKPEWYSSTMVAALETREAPSGEQGTFLPTGRMMMINILNSSSYELTDTGVVDLAVEPLQK